MVIFIDNGKDHIMTKRMLPIWNAIGHTVSSTHQGCPPRSIHLSYVHFSQVTNLKKIVRIDGIYYDKATDYNKRNQQISEAHSKADGIIYQSQFSEWMVPRFLTPKKKTAKMRVIYNGIAENWCGQHIDNGVFNVVVSGIWRRHKRLQETIDVFNAFRKLSHIKTKLHILGNLVENKPVDNPDIIYYGHLSPAAMAAIWRIGDVSIHMSKKDSCPNTVVEAIGAGIPVITTNACGGAVNMVLMTEGCKMIEGDGDYANIEPCYPYTNEYNVLSKRTRGDLVETLLKMSENPYRIKMPERLKIENVAREYLDFMAEVLK
jgi:glycosyltransferase involved in cell wall biosynthesis